MSEFEKFTYSEEIILNKRVIQAAQVDNAEGILSFGVPFLDEALKGIQKNDLILLGAPSGAGKTELASHIAFHNALQNKRVVYFALEAEKNEIEMRASYRYLATNYFKNGGKEYTAYDSWLLGQCPHIDCEHAERPKLKKGCLRTRYVNGIYTVDDFLKDYAEVVGDSDLVILDHLHYFDLETTNENKEYKEIIKKIRTEVLDHGKPMILISHIRKRDRKFPVLCADQEDFHGTSDLVKIATKVISISPQYDFPIYQQNFDGSEVLVQGNNYTFMKVAKNRRNGSVMRYSAAVKYDFRTNTYHGPFFLGSQRMKDKETIFLTEKDTPFWAKSVIQ